MSKCNQKPVPLALSAALVGGLVLSASAFAMQPLAQGYLLSATADAGEKAGEGKCGMEKVDTDKDGKVSRAEFTMAQAAKFDGMDTNKDGFLDAAEHKAHSEGKCGADKNKTDAKAKHAEGKCGEGKCGGSL